jgi:hypothetical protein
VDPESTLEEVKTCDLYRTRTAFVCFVCCAMIVSDARKVSAANVLAMGGDWDRELKFAHELTGKRPVWCPYAQNDRSEVYGHAHFLCQPAHFCATSYGPQQGLPRGEATCVCLSARPRGSGTTMHAPCSMPW